MEQEFEGYQVKEGESVCAVALRYIKVGKVKGRNILKRAGFIQCPNPNYMERNGSFVHYNRLNGTWIFD